MQFDGLNSRETPSFASILPGSIMFHCVFGCSRASPLLNNGNKTVPCKIVTPLFKRTLGDSLRL